MKRELGDSSIPMKRELEHRKEQEGAFVPRLRRVRDVTAYVRMLGDEIEGDGKGSRSALTEDFADFLAGGSAVDRDLVPPSPIFREQLRRRLWRLHTLTRSRARPRIH
jgi:hypothetical protein